MQGLPGAVYEARTHGSVRGMMLDMIIQHHPYSIRAKQRGFSRK
ncbi:MAG: hypothetical protein PHX33_07245 [Candidatus Cloacimonetes bacterium]|nr:hypothetical protein [Candidatus Cloacimonadota bacterium]